VGDSVGDATEKDSAQPAATVRGHHNQVDPDFTLCHQDRGGWITDAEPRTDLEARPSLGMRELVQVTAQRTRAAGLDVGGDAEQIERCMRAAGNLARNWQRRLRGFRHVQGNQNLLQVHVDTHFLYSVERNGRGSERVEYRERTHRVIVANELEAPASGT